jgi:hypothetical protein
MINEIRRVGEMRIGRGKKYSEETAPVPLYSTQIPYKWAWD